MGRIEYFVCPLCGLNRAVKSIRRADKGKPEIVRFDSGRLPELEEMIILQVREGGGKKPGTGKKYRGSTKGSGFHLVEGYTLKEILDKEEYRDIIQSMKEQYLRLLRGFLALGLITREEIEKTITS